MEIVLQIQGWEMLAAALQTKVAGVAVPLPRSADSQEWADLLDWQTAARQRGLKFYLIWDWLVREEDLPGAADLLAAAAAMAPDALVLRDLGIAAAAQRRFPHLPLHAAGNGGFRNSPGLRLAATLGFGRVVLEPPISLKDLGLMRRQTTMPLEVVLPPSCQGFSDLCLLEESLGMPCESCPCGASPGTPLDTLMAALEMLSGLAQQGVEAVQVRGQLFPRESLPLVMELYHTVCAAAPVERAQVLAAARDVLVAFGDRFKSVIPEKPDFSRAESRPEKKAPGPRSSFPPRPPAGTVPRRFIWLEARGYDEATLLAHQWREPLLVELTAENYAAFLKEHRRWGPRRLMWRLPPVIREGEVAFYQKALETLRQGGHQHFVACDWDAAALVRAAGGTVYGDQTLGVRNSWALEAAGRLGVSKVCLPPGPMARRQKLLNAAPSESFWGYLYHVPALAVCPAAANPPAPGANLRWIHRGEHLLLCREVPEQLEDAAGLLRQHGVAPLVVALPRSRLPWGRVPPELVSPPEARRRPRM